jgi:hypothetical protein
MFGTVATVLLLCSGADAVATSSGLGVPAVDPFGFLYQPSHDLHKPALLPARAYEPQAGDVLLMSNSNMAWELAYKLALTGKPGHSSIVIRMPDGRPGILEAGIGETLWTKFVPAEERLHDYPGTIWIRRRSVPLTECQDSKLTEFALLATGHRYDICGFARQLTPFRSRGPIRTYFMGKPRGPGQKYFCAEAVLEGLVHACVLDSETTRPSATYPRDMFFDESPNLYISKHPPLACGWEKPALWTPCVGSTASGKERGKLQP